MGTFVSGAAAADGAAYAPAAGTDTLLVWIPYLYRSGTATASAQDFGGATLTEDHDESINIIGSGDPSVNLNYLVNPGTTSQTLSLTWSGTPVSEGGYAITLDGIDQTTPKNNSDSSTFTNHTPALTYSAASGDVVIYWKYYGGNVTPTFAIPATGFNLETQDNIITSPAYRGFVCYYKEITATETSVSIGADTSGGTTFGGCHGVIVFSGAGAGGGAITTSQSGTATTTGTATMARVVSLLRTLTATVVAVPTIARLLTAIRALSSSAVGTVTNSRLSTYARSFSAVGLGTSISAIGALLTFVFSAIATGSSSFSSASVIGRTLSAIVNATASGTKLVGKVLVHSAVGSAGTTLLGNYFRSFSSVATGAVTSVKQSSYFRAFTASAVGSVLASAAAVIGIFIELLVTVIGTPSVTKVVGKSLTATVAGTTSVAKYIFRLFTITATSTSTQNEAYLTAVIAAAAVNGIVSATQTFVVGVAAISTLVREKLRSLKRNITRVFKR